MPSHRHIDAGREVDWGKTSTDYATHRPGPPQSFYEKLRAFDVGVPGQRILDLGTGTGALAREFARRGACVSGVDISAEQVSTAAALAAREGVEVDLRTAPAEELPFSDDSFDVVSANQCWLYFDTARAIPEVVRVLAPRGVLVVSHFSFLPRLDPIARVSEEVVLAYNPDWSGADWDGKIPSRPRWSRDHFDLRAMFTYDEEIPFTRASWRGRMRALRGIGASLPADRVAAFDAELDRVLGEVTPAEFTVLHRIDAHVFAPIPRED